MDISFILMTIQYVWSSSNIVRKMDDTMQKCNGGLQRLRTLCNQIQPKIVVDSGRWVS